MEVEYEYVWTTIDTAAQKLNIYHACGSDSLFSAKKVFGSI